MSASSSRSSSPSNISIQTNSLILTKLPTDFFHPMVMKVLCDHFETFGEVNQWVALPSLRRVIVVYVEAEHAEAAKLHSDPLVLEGNEHRDAAVLRVYRSTPNPLIRAGTSRHMIHQSSYLKPPPLDKNFLISPPGSPPEGWEPIKEDPPNPTPLAEDLMEALRRLQLRHNHLEKESNQRQQKEMIMEPEDGVGICVYVEFHGSTEESREEEWVYGQPSPARDRWKPMPASMPPPIHV